VKSSGNSGRLRKPPPFAIDQISVADATVKICGGKEISAMAAQQQSKTMNAPSLPNANDLRKEIARKEAEKASLAMRERSAAENERQALLEKFSKPSGVSNDDRLERAIAIIRRAANNGQTEVEVTRFPNALCTDRGRAINQQEPGWEKTLTGLPKELFEFWQTYLKPQGYRLRVQIVEFPGGVPGDIGLTLSWG
jgi:hypothetical protein